MPTITQLEYVIAVDRLKNFSRAAEECHVSQPSLSAQIQKIEDELNLIIFDRSKKPVLTTPQGEVVVKRAKNVLAELRKLIDVASADTEPSGYFHVAIIPTVAPYLIPVFVEQFSKLFPKVNLKVSEQKTDDIIKNIYDDKIDAGILVTPLYNDKIVEKHLYYEDFYVFASGGHKLLKNESIKDSDLDPESIWLLEEGHCLRDQVVKICAYSGRHNVLDNVNFASGSLETIINMVRKGRGYTLLPALALGSLTESERNNSVKKFSPPTPTREVSVVHSKNFLKQNMIQGLIQSITETLPENLTSDENKKKKVIDI